MSVCKTAKEYLSVWKWVELVTFHSSLLMTDIFFFNLTQHFSTNKENCLPHLSKIPVDSEGCDLHILSVSDHHSNLWSETKSMVQHLGALGMKSEGETRTPPPSPPPGELLRHHFLRLARFKNVALSLCVWKKCKEVDPFTYIQVLCIPNLSEFVGYFPPSLLLMCCSVCLLSSC